MRTRFAQVVLLIAFALTSNALAQKGQHRPTDCRIGTVTVITSAGGVPVRTSGRMLDLFGRSVHADHLVQIVSESLTPTTEEKFRCDDENLLGAVYLLASVKDKRVLGPLLVMSESTCPHIRHAVVGSMAKLGDRRALPRLREILRNRDQYGWSAVLALEGIGDETTIKDLIDTIPAGGARDAEARFKAIEKITGLSLEPIRNKWGLLYYDNLPQLHQAMHAWWAANKHRAKIKKTL